MLPCMPKGIGVVAFLTQSPHSLEFNLYWDRTRKEKQNKIGHRHMKPSPGDFQSTWSQVPVLDLSRFNGWTNRRGNCCKATQPFNAYRSQLFHYPHSRALRSQPTISSPLSLSCARAQAHIRTGSMLWRGHLIVATTRELGIADCVICSIELQLLKRLIATQIV